MSGEIRAPHEEEFHTIYELGCVAFGSQPVKEDEDAHRLGFPFDRALCAYDDGRMVATAAVYTQELTIPGGATLPMGGVTWISTLPTHRRQGLLRRLMVAMSTDMFERDEVVSGLGASETTIYGRFGYGPATSVMSFSVLRGSAFALPVDRSAVGRLKLLGPEEAATRLPAIYEGHRLSQAGAVGRPQVWWNGYLADAPSEREEGAGPTLHVTHESIPGVPDGYVSYGIKEAWEGSTAHNTVMVLELLAADPRVYAALWNYLLNTDLCHAVNYGRGRIDEPLRWLLADPRRFRVNALSDFLWLRFLDVPRALAARSYRAEDDLVLEVCESFPEPRVSRLLLRTGPAGTPGAECAPTTRPADLSLDTVSLAAAYLGGVSWSTLAAAGRVRELQTGTVERADALFATDRAPYCVTEF
jgi:predicted acetyltransferase